MKKSLIMLIAAMTLAGAQTMARDYTRLHLTDVEVSLSEGNHAVNVSMTVNPAQWKLGLNRYVTLTPVLRSATTGDSLVLRPITIAGRNMYYNRMRAGDAEIEHLLRAGHGSQVTYIEKIPFENWMTVSDIDFRFEQEGCCGGEVAPDEILPLAHIDLTPVEYKATLAYMEPVAAPKAPRHISGKAYVVFPVNQTYIDPMYEVDGKRPNIPELGKIMASIDTVRLNSDATVNMIKLTGYASPEGPYLNNVRLARERTEAVKEYVRKQYDFPASIYQTASVPEDWDGLRDSVAVSFLEDRSEMLEFIDDTSIPIAEKNDRFRARFPRSYNYLLKQVYPWLRHTNYDITYTIREYDNIEEILKVLATRPQNLSIREFYLAASNYPVGSEDYDNVWLTAVTMYPEDELVNINAGYAALNRDDMRSARRYLGNAGDSKEADMARGVLAAKEGDYDTAKELLNNAASLGHSRAAEALEQIDSIQSKREPVTYTYNN